MGKFIDLTGQTFNGILVLERDYNVADKKRTYWKCQCKCGNIFTTRGDGLKSGHTQSCGNCPTKKELKKIALQKERDLTGQVFGRLKVISKDSDSKRNYWICECKCGNIVSRRSDSLKSQGEKASCGCRKRELTSQQWSAELEGQRFGKLLVLERVKSEQLRSLWKCQCDCGNIVFFPSRYLLSMGMQSCGCETHSLGELCVRKQLQELNCSFKEQYSFQDCLTENNHRIKFDFAILDKQNNVKCLIEYNGKQHYEEVEFFGGAENLERQKLRDNIKRDYCFKNNIPLIEIPYTISLKDVNVEKMLEEQNIL